MQHPSNIMRNVSPIYHARNKTCIHFIQHTIVQTVQTLRAYNTKQKNLNKSKVNKNTKSKTSIT